VKVRGEGAAWFDPVAAATSFQVDNGKITSADGRIDCGIVDGVRTSLCTADFPWDGTPVVLTATGSTGFGHHMFAGSCSGIADCSLSGNADKMVLVRFAATREGLGAHPNFSDEAIHGPEYANYVAGGPGALNCAQCHGATLQGAGIALSCATCHPAPAPGPGGAVALTRTEQCAGCHAGAGAFHQAEYDEYTDASDLVITIASLATADPDGDTTLTATMTVDITKDGAPYTGTIAAFPQKTFYATTYDAGTRKFDTTVNFNANTAAAVAGTPGRFTVRSSASTTGDATANVTSPLRFRPEDGPTVAFVYVADEPMPFEAFTVYNNVAHAGREFGTVEYVSAANDADCQRCHGTPYRKHGYRVAATTNLDDFAACKVCHYDTRNGGHQAWQLLVDDPATYAAQDGATTPAQNAKYPYKASVMNDTHMSHAMEFAYPQSMANCVTCHNGKLNLILTDANFTLATCKSCHPVTGVGGTDAKRAPALGDLMAASAFNHAGAGMDPESLYTTFTGNCNGCHNASGASSFSEIHTGYNTVIYADAVGTKYSDAFEVSITDADYDTSTKELTFSFTVTESPDIAGVAVSDVVPTVLVSMYGFDTKDFIVGAHVSHSDGMRNLEWDVTALPGTNNCDTNGDHVIDATDDPCPEFARMGVVSSGGGTWTIRADLGEAEPTGLIDDGTVKRIEIGVIPTLHDAGEIVALDMVTRTFDLDANAFADGFYPAIVKVDGCNKCHEALATTFHDADRGGSVVGCRLCHTTLSGGSHLEGQSRSIDSYIHAIHAMQPFDIGDVDFTDPVEALHYDHHIESTYPNFTLLNCESCHNPGTYEVPSHLKSLPGILSKNDTVTGRSLTFAGVVTGPGARACGSCHRVPMINEVQAAELAAFDAHTAAFGYRDAGTTRSVFDSVIAKVQEYIDYLLP
jgi:hypothetical protein